jgi:tol-pal system protein YbgF
LLAGASAASAQSNDGGFLGGLFGGGDRGAQGERPVQSNPGELSVRIDRLEAQIRQLTGTIEQLQYRNQQLADQLSRLEASLPPGQVRPIAQTTTQPPVSGGVAVPTAGSTPPGRRDAFDPNQNPNAPGVPRTLGSVPASNGISDGGPIGAPGGRAAGEPLNLSTMNGDATPTPPGTIPGQDGAPRGSGGGTQVATLPPTDSPKDNFDLGYGYILHKDYALAEDAFRTFLRKYPSDRQAPDAEYWLGESLFQRQRYRDAAESFLNVSTKYESTAKAPDALLRLGQSLAELGEKEAACASLGEVLRKYPRAALSVKQGVDREQKRDGC